MSPRIGSEAKVTQLQKAELHAEMTGGAGQHVMTSVKVSLQRKLESVLEIHGDTAAVCGFLKSSKN